MDYLKKIITDFEIQSVEGVRECFEHGVDPNLFYNGKPLIYELINEYPRGPQVAECVKLFIDYGLKFEDKVLLAVLSDDAPSLDRELCNNPDAMTKTYSLDCVFTPLFESSLLHICAEYNHVSAAKILIKHGADVNQKAGVDKYGFGGHTPIFHTVNQHANKCIDMMNYLITESADLSATVKGLIWGKGYEWETFIPAVNPISYAMMGLLPQFQRKEALIYEVVNILLKALDGTDYKPANIPNTYLKK